MTCNQRLRKPGNLLYVQVLLHDAAVAIGLLDITTDVDSGSALPAGCSVPTAFDDDPDTAFALAEDKLVSAVRAGGVLAPDLLTWSDV